MKTIAKMFYKNTVRGLDIMDHDLQTMFSEVRNLAIQRLIASNYSRDTSAGYVTSTHIIQR